MLKASLIALMLSAAPAFAQSFQDQYVQQLQEQGFTQISVQRTLLGRVRIVALSDEYRREIVFIPSTGTILRDYWIELEEHDDDEHDDDYRLFDPSGGSGGEDDDDHDDDDDDDDEDDDEEDDDEEDDDDDESDDDDD